MNETKLYISAAIFLGLTVAKIIAPDFITEVKDDVNTQIDRNIDYTATISQLNSFANEYSYLWKLSDDRGEADMPSPIPIPDATIFNSTPIPTIIPTPLPIQTPVPTPTATPIPTPEIIEESEVGLLPFEYAEPLTVEVSSHFGSRIHPVYGDERFHYGMDINAVHGAPINAFADGIVTLSEYSDSYGYYIIIEHNESYSTLYAHCSELFATVGQTVSMGEHIANVGATGLVTGAHLHFEVIENGEQIDPAMFLC